MNRLDSNITPMPVSSCWMRPPTGSGIFWVVSATAAEASATRPSKTSHTASRSAAVVANRGDERRRPGQQQAGADVAVEVAEVAAVVALPAVDERAAEIERTRISFASSRAREDVTQVGAAAFAAASD